MLIYYPISCAEQAPELATALGDMVLAWQHAEEAQTDCFIHILRIEHYKASRIYQKLPNYRSRTMALLTLLELYPDFAPIQRHILKLSKLSKTRNRWIHGSMIKAWQGGEIRAVDLDEPTDTPARSKPLKAADITNHSDAVRRVADQLIETLQGLQAYRDSEAFLALERLRAQGPPDRPSEGPTPQPETEG